MNPTLTLAIVALLAQQSDWIDELLFGVGGGRVTSEPENVEARPRFAEFRARAEAFRPRLSARGSDPLVREAAAVLKKWNGCFAPRR